VAVEDVTRDIPAITTDLGALIARADAVVAQIQNVVAASAPGFSGFATTGLSELTRLSGEARNLVTTLNSLVRRIERDPARFLLDDRVPEYRK
jgi:phospholipid/cholesterol/gamma-HCH transport system substrate-binding protein